MRTTAIRQPSRCPTCDDELQAASHVDKAVPKPGDLCICINCGAAMLFQTDFTPRLATLQEMSTAPPQVFSMISRIVQRGLLRPRGSRT